ncbi:MAG: hypothetical protein H6672_21315 [Anaerolineaceae bacterium]|nr:hypothetical protein [Anaerolineaceae bacterium]
MPFKVDWLIKGRVIHDWLSGNVEMDDIAETSKLITDLMRQGDPPLVHLIVDILDVTRLPLGINIGKINQYMQHTKEPNLGWSLVITESMFMRFLASVVTQIAQGRFRAFTTMEDALAFLQDVDASLPPLPSKIPDFGAETASSEPVAETKDSDTKIPASEPVAEVINSEIVTPSSTPVAEVGSSDTEKSSSSTPASEAGSSDTEKSSSSTPASEAGNSDMEKSSSSTPAAEAGSSDTEKSSSTPAAEAGSSDTEKSQPAP